MSGEDVFLFHLPLKTCCKSQLAESLNFSAPKSKGKCRDFPGGPKVKNPPVSAGDMGLIPGLDDPIWHRETKPVRHNY